MHRHLVQHVSAVDHLFDPLPKFIQERIDDSGAQVHQQGRGPRQELTHFCPKIQNEDSD